MAGHPETSRVEYKRTGDLTKEAEEMIDHLRETRGGKKHVPNRGQVFRIQRDFGKVEKMEELRSKDPLVLQSFRTQKLSGEFEGFLHYNGER